MARDRVICSHEKLCGCVIEPKKGDIVVNPSMKNCARFITEHSATRYCCVTREMVHIIK